MKRIIFTTTMALLLLVGMGSNTAKAQHDVKFNFLAMIFNNYGFSYEYVLSEEMSVGSTMNFYSRTQSETVLDTAGISVGKDYKYTGFNIAPEFRFYFAPDDDAEGFFVAPYFKYRTKKSDGWDYTDTNGAWQETWRKRSGLAFGVGLGKKWVADAGFIYETYFGIGKYLTDKFTYGNSRAEEYWEQFDDDFTVKLDLRFGLSIGWRFGG
jgi:hypothetical protein